MNNMVRLLKARRDAFYTKLETFLKSIIMLRERMSGEKIVLDLNNSFNKDESYRFINYLKDNTGVFITSISIFATFLVFGSKVVSYLIANVQYQYWGLAEGLFIEDNTAYLKLGVYTMYMLFAIIAYVIAKKNVYLWELYNCITYLYKKVIKNNKKRLDKSAKETKLIKRLFKAILKADEYNRNDESYPKTAAELVELVKVGIEISDENIKEFRHDYYNGRKRIVMWKIKHSGYLLIGFLVILLASFILQASTGLSLNQEDFLGITKSMLLGAVILFAEIIIGAWVEVKLNFLVNTKAFFKDEKLLHDNELVDKIIDVLQERIITVQISGIKSSFSDRACKSYIIYVLSLAILAFCFLPSIAKANLEKMDTFYIVEYDTREYAVLENYGNKYILAECEIEDESINILSSNICIVNEPIKMYRRKFETVNKEICDAETVSLTEK